MKNNRLSILMVCILMLNSVYAYSAETLNQAYLTATVSQAEEIFNKMNKEEMVGALGEINAQIASLKEDLRQAEETGDGRLSVKIRNISLSVTGASILIIILTAVAESTFGKEGKNNWFSNWKSKRIDSYQQMVWSVLGIAVAGVAMSISAGIAVSLTKSEAQKISGKISLMEEKVNRIVSKISK
jgi:hypothetical protein